MPINLLKMKTFASNQKGFLIFVVLMLMFRSAVADWNDVPTGSMKPTIVEGDRILINKLAYDVRLPFTQTQLFHLDDPSTGDIIIFESEAAGKRLVKRVIGVPGDTISLENNQLIVNNLTVPYRFEGVSAGKMHLQEQLASGSHAIQISRSPSRMATMPEVVVPTGHYLVLGDNRDNSADSRVIGFVPRDEIIGRTQRVAFSLDYDNYLLPRTSRFFKTL